MEYQYCSATRIRVSNREFKSVEGLIRSGYQKGLAKQLLGEYVIWWKDCRVMFPDKEPGHSSSMVEVIGRSVTIGHPACYYTYHFSKIIQALEFADCINKAWLAYEGTWRDFLNQELEKHLH